MDGHLPPFAPRRQALLSAVLVLGVLLAGLVVIRVPTSASAGTGGSDQSETVTYPKTPVRLPESQPFQPESTTVERMSLVDGRLEIRPSSSGTSVMVSVAPARAVVVTVSEVSESAGPVVRYADDFNFWVLLPVTRYGAWRLARIGGGTVVESYPLPLTTYSAGTSVALFDRSDGIDVVVNEELAMSVATSELDFADRVGVAVVGAQGAAFATVRVL